jgi:hypothetical protein
VLYLRCRLFDRSEASRLGAERRANLLDGRVAAAGAGANGPAVREDELRTATVLKLAMLAWGFGVAQPLHAQVKPDLIESFEDEGWRDNWRSTESSLGPRLTTPEMVPAFDGRRALRVELHPGDHLGAGGATERVEIHSQRVLVRFDREVWYSFAVFVPGSFPRADNRTVIHQIKEDVGQGAEAGCGGASPFFAIETRGDPDAVHVIVRRTFSPACGHNKTHLFEGHVSYDAWHVFAVDLKASHEPAAGFVRVWLDGAPVAACRGGFGYPAMGLGYVDAQPRFGIYRDVLQQPAVIFFDRLAFWSTSPLGSPLWPAHATDLADPAALPSCGTP